MSAALLQPMRAHGAAADDWTPRRAPDLVDAEIDAWPDAWLIAAVACEPPDARALDALVARYREPLYGRCRMLTADGERARDLAQETWSRVLRARRRLRSHDNFAGFLVTVATNIWRDWKRTARRAGALAGHRVASLDGELRLRDGDGVALGELLPDPHYLASEDQTVLRMDVDRALARLAPRSREVLTARFIDGESAAEIGARYGRTEQTITAWLRKATRELRQYLQDAPAARATARRA